MKQPTPQLLALMATAAALRAGGAPWERVATQVRRSAETCRHWPRLYPDVWDRLYRHAEEELFGEAVAEAAVTLRRLLRSDSEKVCLDAARLLLRERQDQRRAEGRTAGKKGDPAEPAVIQFVRHVKSLSDDQLDALVEQYLQHRRRSGTDPVAGGDGAPGPALPE